MENIILLVFIAVGILQIVMIIKFFQIASDVREIKNMQVNACKQVVSSSLSFGKTDISFDEKLECARDFTYSRNGENINFSDGFSGKIKIYTGYPECSIITDENYELLYNNMDYAIAALHDYLKDHIERQEGLYKKRKY